MTVNTAEYQRWLQKNKRKAGRPVSNGKFRCHICNKGYARKFNLKYHIQGAHSGIHRHNCTCGKRFPWLQQLINHKKYCPLLNQQEPFVDQKHF